MPQARTAKTAKQNAFTPEVLIIGAGPAGTVAASYLCQAGIEPLVLEKSQFPRFSIGESLLPQTMDIMAECGLVEAVEAQAEALGFQLKNGATFHFKGKDVVFDFAMRFGPGWDYTYEVPRANFDNLLAEQAINKGADIRFGHEITNVNFDGDYPVIQAKTDNGDALTIQPKFVLDASGFARVLPRFLDLNTPSNFPARRAIFTHVTDNADSKQYDRNKIRVAIHPDNSELWTWMIPFSNGRMSIGAVGALNIFDNYAGEPADILKTVINNDPCTADLLKDAVYDSEIRQTQGFAANVKSLHGKNYALLGNAAEFLDPIFSSGVTIAMKSAQLATQLYLKEKQGTTVDWDVEYGKTLQNGVDTFRAYVSGWYNGQLETIFTSKEQPERVRETICAILAGYVWNTDNPFVKRPQARLDALAAIAKKINS